MKLKIVWYEKVEINLLFDLSIGLDNDEHVETVCLLSNRKSKPDSYVDLSVNMEDYHRIKNEEK